MKTYIPVQAGIFCFLLILSVLPVNALAQDDCRNLLMNGFFNEYSGSKVRLRDQAMYAELCSLSFPEARAAVNRAKRSGDGSVGVSYGLFSPGESRQSTGASLPLNSWGMLEEDRFRQWKSAYCSKNSAANSSSAAEFLMQKATSRPGPAMAPAAQAWSACMRKREGLTCWAVPYANQNGEEDVVLNVNWTQAGHLSSDVQRESQPQVVHSFLSRGAVAKFEGTPARRLLPVGHKLGGTLQIPLERSADKAVIASLKVEYKEKEHSCDVFIPGERDFALTTPFPR